MSSQNSSDSEEPNVEIPALPTKANPLMPPSNKPKSTLLDSPFERLSTPLTTPIYKFGSEGPIFLCLHGLGLSSQSFGPLCQYVKNFGTLITFDFPQHHQNPNTLEYSLKNLVDLSAEILDYIQNNFEQNVILVGHSMGGAIATHLAKEREVSGLLVIDVVEGTALEALEFMEGMATNRKKSFTDPSEVIDWYLKGGMVKNRESLRMTVGGQVKEVEGKWRWRVDLLESQMYWREWFVGLTKAFLEVRVPKLLLIAEKERMDKELTIAQMQGKFQLAVLYNVGHYMQEDDPKNTARQLHNFIKVFKIPQNKEEMRLLKEIGVGKFKPDLKEFV